MTPKDYLEQSGRTDLLPDVPMERLQNKVLVNLWHAIAGLSTEANELLDQLISHTFYGKELDITNIKEECGDALWFLTKIFRQYGWTFEEIMELNNKKLKIRYPEKFTEKDAINRDLDKEREVLDKRLL